MGGATGIFGLALWQSAIVTGLLTALVTMGVTRSIERFGGIIGGALSSSPTTVLIVGLGFYAALDRLDFQLAMLVIPLGMLSNCGFLFCWRKIPSYLDLKKPLSRNLAIMIILTTLYWLCTAVAVYFFNTELLGRHYDATLIVACIAFGVNLIFGALVAFEDTPAPKGKNPVSWPMLFLRGVIAGISIGCTIFLSTTSSVAAGILSTLPVIFMTAMVSLWVSQGTSVPSGAAGPMILGSSSVSLYAIVYCLLAPKIGPGPAFPVSYVICILSISLPTVYYLQFVRSHFEKKRQHWPWISKPEHAVPQGCPAPPNDPPTSQNSDGETMPLLSSNPSRHLSPSSSRHGDFLTLGPPSTAISETVLALPEDALDAC